MKRTLIFGLALLFVSTALFADDAKVMPARVGRFYLAPTYGFTHGEFDEEGRIVGSLSTMRMFNLGLALEYGITNWITGAIQWAPGWNMWSNINTIFGESTYANMNGVADLFLGAKMQIIGTQAPVVNEMFRLAFAPGIKIPLPGPDFEEQGKNRNNGDSFTVGNIDNHVLGLGLRSYLDFIVNENFFINLYNEVILYPVKGDFAKAGVGEYLNLAGTNAAIAALDSSVEGKINYGYALTFELEPTFTANIADRTIFTAGLPLNYQTSPGAKYEFTGSGVAGAGAAEGLGAIFEDGKQSHLLAFKPNASVFFMGWALPMEFKLQYSAALAGKNNNALNTLTFQARFYFKF